MYTGEGETASVLAGERLRCFIKGAPYRCRPDAALVTTCRLRGCRSQDFTLRTPGGNGFFLAAPWSVALVLLALSQALPVGVPTGRNAVRRLHAGVARSA
ncbi:MAG: hypothetical protein OXD35_14205 [Thiotrichales bacterium]|nr:hypothetical protein [Thiotrichales bacterium]